MEWKLAEKLVVFVWYVCLQWMSSFGLKGIPPFPSSSYLGEVVGRDVVAIASSLTKDDPALFGESAADGSDEPKGLVDRHKEQDAFSVVDGLLSLAHVGIEGTDQEAKKGTYAKLWQGGVSTEG